MIWYVTFLFPAISGVLTVAFVIFGFFFLPDGLVSAHVHLSLLLPQSLHRNLSTNQILHPSLWTFSTNPCSSRARGMQGLVWLGALGEVQEDLGVQDSRDVQQTEEGGSIFLHREQGALLAAHHSSSLCTSQQNHLGIEPAIREDLQAFAEFQFSDFFVQRHRQHVLDQEKHGCRHWPRTVAAGTHVG